MLVNERHLAELNSPIQKIQSRVELHNGSTLEKICTCNNYVSNFSIERVGEGKFFGYGICHKLNINFIDPNRDLNLTNIDSLEVTLGVNGEFVYPFPVFYITSEINRDETTNEISLTAYDALYESVNHKASELDLLFDVGGYSLRTLALACATLLGMPMKIIGVDDGAFDVFFDGNANLDGNESIRYVLNAIAEATQTIYYMSGDWELTFKRLDQAGDPVLTIDRNQYIDLKSGVNNTLTRIETVTDLGNNVYSGEEGVTQYIRNNPFYELRTDTQELLDNAVAAISGLTINPFECNWIGNYLVEIGDKIALIAENDNEIITYMVDDSISFDGTLGQYSRWEYIHDEAETVGSPTSLGEALNQTFARVDKANKQITLLVNEVSVNKNTTDAELQSIKENQTTFTQTANDINLRVESIETTGATKVKTGTGFTFDEEGLRINKDNSGIENLIDNTGMYVKQDGAEVLSVNEVGVKAKDLHAVTYLWIGSHSRFEDYEGNRTGCFWIGK